MAKKKISDRALGAMAAVGLAAGLALNLWLARHPGQSRLFAWLIMVAVILFLLACIGKSIRNNWTGVIESARNRVSLSRLQMLLWTVLVLSAILTAGISNFYADSTISALAITIPQDLLVAMGISATSLVAAPAVLSLKATPEPNVAATAAQGVSAGIHRRSSSADTSWLDIFRGDEEGNCDTPDLSKIQQFLITLALVGLYGALIGQMFLSGGRIDELPALAPNFLWLLGISHAGYLTYKAVPHPAAGGSGQTAAAGTPTPSDDDAVG